MILTMITAIENDSDRDFMIDIYDRYEKLIRRTIYKIVRNSYDTEDIAQDVFIKLIGNISTIRNLSCHKMFAYVVNTSRSTTINFIKHRDVVRKHTFSGNGNDLSADLEGLSVEFEEQLIHQIDVELLSVAIQKLPDQQKSILFDKYLLEKSDAEISKGMGIAESSVRQYLKRARTAARKLFGEGPETYAE